MHKGQEGMQRVTGELIDRVGRNTLPAALTNPERQRKTATNIWTGHSTLVERYNEPGKFTAFMGFEYTLMPGGNNLHRVVMFRDGKSRTDKVLPYDPGQGDTPVSQLWDYMDNYEKVTGGKVLAIPHNSNLSNGLMFELVGPDGGPMTAAYARRRAAREPITEITQIKGDSESHPFLSPNDEFSGFGTAGWDLGNLTMQAAKKPQDYAGEYIREALKRGLAIEARTDDTDTRSILALIDHAVSRRAVETERAFLAELGAGCSLPVGAHLSNDGVFRAFMANDDFSDSVQIVGSIGDSDDNRVVGITAAIECRTRLAKPLS
jgi:hypothetical protein